MGVAVTLQAMVEVEQFQVLHEREPDRKDALLKALRQGISSAGSVSALKEASIQPRIGDHMVTYSGMLVSNQRLPEDPRNRGPQVPRVTRSQ